MPQLFVEAQQKRLYQLENAFFTEATVVLKISLKRTVPPGKNWDAFVVEDGSANATCVQVGHRNAFEAEILNGVNESSTIVIHLLNGSPMAYV